MRRALLVVALLALVAGGSAPAKPFHELLGIVTEGRTARLVVLDPETLNVADGPSVVIGADLATGRGTWAFSPDRSKLAYADMNGLHFYDLFTFTHEGNAKDVNLVGGGAVAWLEPDPVAMLRRVSNNVIQVVKVDPRTRAVRSRQRIVGTVVAACSAPGVLVALLGRNAKIAPVRMLVVEPRRTRVLAVTGVRAGTVWQGKNPPIGTIWTPGLALDEATSTAYIADPSGLVVAISVRGLTPSAHVVRGSLTKVVHSYQRRVVSLGDGLLAITGEEFSPEQMRPAGVELVDTRTWTSHLVELAARGAWAAGEGLVVTGSAWGTTSQRRSAMGLAVLDRAGHARFRLFEGSSAWVNALVGSRAWVGVEGESELVVVDLSSGQVVGHRTFRLPTLLQARSSSDQ